jgi:hypothetical protein
MSLTRTSARATVHLNSEIEEDRVAACRLGKAGAVSFDDALHPLHRLWGGELERVMAAL